MRRSILTLSVLIAAISAASADGVAAQVNVEVFELHLRPRASVELVTSTFTVRNSSDSTQQVRFSLRDWRRDSLGNNVYSPHGSHTDSCADRIEVFPPTLQLAARGSASVRVSYAPESATSDPGCWSLVLAEGVRPPSQESRSGQTVVVTVVQGVKIYVHPMQSVLDGELAYADVEQSRVPAPSVPASSTDSTDVRDFVVRYLNTGNEHLSLKLSVEIRDESSTLLHRLQANQALITPNAYRDILLRLPTLARGRYVAVALVDFGGPEVQAAQVDFDVP